MEQTAVSGAQAKPYYLISKSFNEGGYPAAMTEIRTTEGYKAGTMVDVARLRLSNPELLKIYFDTSTGATGVGGGLVISHNTPRLINITPQEKLSLDGIISPPGYTPEGTFFSKSQLSKMILNTPMSQKDAKLHPINEVLYGQHKDDYIDAIFDAGKFKEGMGIYPNHSQGLLRMWVADSLDNRAYAVVRFHLGINAHLLAVSLSEGAGAAQSGQSLEDRLTKPNQNTETQF